MSNIGLAIPEWRIALPGGPRSVSDAAGMDRVIGSGYYGVSNLTLLPQPTLICHQEFDGDGIQYCRLHVQKNHDHSPYSFDR